MSIEQVTQLKATNHLNGFNLFDDLEKMVHFSLRFARYFNPFIKHVCLICSQLWASNDTCIHFLGILALHSFQPQISSIIASLYAIQTKRIITLIVDIHLNSNAFVHVNMQVCVAQCSVMENTVRLTNENRVEKYIHSINKQDFKLRN